MADEAPPAQTDGQSGPPPSPTPTPTPKPPKPR